MDGKCSYAIHCSLQSGCELINLSDMNGRYFLSVFLTKKTASRINKRNDMYVFNFQSKFSFLFSFIFFLFFSFLGLKFSLKILNVES